MLKPDVKIGGRLINILRELEKLEKEFHYPSAGKSRTDFESLMDDSFWEVGASGRAYDKGFVLDCLEVRCKESAKADMSDFNCLEIAPDCYLLSYVQSESSRITRRSAIWRKVNKQWKNLYHQGTVCS